MMKISELTRRDIIETLSTEKINWYGRLNEIEFLSRIFDLSNMPSSDNRFSDMASDIWQHRVNNNDWDDNWIFSDGRLDLMSNDDAFLRFLAETLHPAVRSDSSEVERLLQKFNDHLQPDGFQLVVQTFVSGKPIFVGKYTGVDVMPLLALARDALVGTDHMHVSQQISRIETAVVSDPALAIGTAKEVVETCCKTILTERGISFNKNTELPELVKRTYQALELTPDDIAEKAKASKSIKRLLSNLATITQGIAELRNLYGTGHGNVAKAKGLQPRHAKLAAGAAITLAVFLTETHNIRLKSSEED